MPLWFVRTNLSVFQNNLCLIYHYVGWRFINVRHAMRFYEDAPTDQHTSELHLLINRIQVKREKEHRVLTAGVKSERQL